MSSILIVNDDGIDSPLLHALVNRFLKIAPVVVAAPRHEQSWVSKSMSRFKPVESLERSDLGCPAYSIAGSPADCVNLALGHLLPEPPLCVVSGINVGHNAGLAYILSSGTIGAALEGALHAIPSFAASMGLDRGDYDRLKDNPGALGETLGAKAVEAANLLAVFVQETLARRENPYAIVHSLNFPSSPLAGAKIVPTLPALTKAGSFFAPQGKAYGFHYRELLEHAPVPTSDRAALLEGNVSYTRLDFARIGATTS